MLVVGDDGVVILSDDDDTAAFLPGDSEDNEVLCSVQGLYMSLLPITQ